MMSAKRQGASPVRHGGVRVQLNNDQALYEQCSVHIKSEGRALAQ
ncbi:MAG: hypothetical protein AAB767_00425 [Patescibacteria group bacterium]